MKEMPTFLNILNVFKLSFLKQITILLWFLHLKKMNISLTLSCERNSSSLARSKLKPIKIMMRISHSRLRQLKFIGKKEKISQKKLFKKNKKTKKLEHQDKLTKLLIVIVSLISSEI